MMIQIIFLSFFTTIIASTVSNPGSCPTPPPGRFGICVELCSNDGNCAKNQKCCSNGCGHVCTNVTSAPCNPVACKCPYGTIWFKDENGCDMCTCKQQDPCATVRCAAGTVCQVNPADNTASCVPNCSQVMCAMYCEYGFEYDNNGCPVCRCLDPCANAGCSSDEICTIKNNTCKTFSSSCQPYTGVCTPNPCTPVACKCRYGTIWFKDENGCDVCSCKPDPCSTVRCPGGTVCQVNPDDNTASCVPNCSPAMCLMYCEYGFEYDNTGCPICKCLEPCAACSSTQVCTVKNNTCATFSASCQPYVGVCTPKCGPVCDIYCPYGHLYDDNGCQKCGCSNPCANVKCGLNQVCTPQKSSCTPYSSTCSEYTGVCLRKCNNISTCNLKCKYGLFYDVWGCPQCKCLDPCVSVLCPPKRSCNVQKSACQTFNIMCQPYVGVCN